MQITDSNLDSLRVGFDTAFMDGFMDADDSPIYTQKLSQVRTSRTATTRFGMQARVPKLREWLGDRQFNNLAEYAYSLSAKNYEGGIEVLREQILEDSLGIFTDSLGKLGRQARKHTDDLLVTLLQNGQTSLCYDGQYFFDTDHPSVKGASGSQSNYSSSSMALTRPNVATVRATMMSYLGDDGRPLGVRPNLLIVPPALEDTADQIAKSEFVINTAGAAVGAGAAPMSNTQMGKYEVLVMPELAGADTTWYMAATKQKAPPLVVVENMGIVSEFLGQGSEHTFKTLKFLYGVSWRGTAGYGMWFSMYKAIA